MQRRRDRPADAVTTSGSPPDLIAVLDHVYGLRRDCLLNELYYGSRLRRYSEAAFYLEVTIVVGSGASGVSGWIIWTTYPRLGAVWGVIAAASTLLAALKPALKIDAKIQRYNGLFAAYRVLSATMAEVVDAITAARAIPASVEKECDRVRSRYKALSADDDPAPARKLVRTLQNDVNRRVPPQSLWYP